MFWGAKSAALLVRDGPRRQSMTHALQTAAEAAQPDQCKDIDAARTKTRPKLKHQKYNDSN